MSPAAPAAKRPQVPTSAAWIFLGIWAISYILYPFWMPLDGSPVVAALLYAIVVALGLVLLRLLLPSLEEKKEAWPHPRLPRDPILWTLLILSAVIRFYPMTLPAHLWGAGDEAVHMGFPALPFKLWARIIPLPFPIVFWSSAALAWFFRRHWTAYVRNWLIGAARGRLLPLLTLLSGAVLYFAIVFRSIRHFSRSGYPTLIPDLLRTPPLAKAVHALFYAAFGVSDFTGRLPEFLFYAVSAVLIYLLALEFRSKRTARLATLLYLFLPPMAYYAMRGSQTHGELFFYILTAYLFGLWLKNRQTSLMYWATVAASAGTLYRYTVLPLLAVLALSALREWRRSMAGDTIRCSVLASAAAAPWACSYLFLALRPYGAGSHGFLEGFLEPALSVPAGVSWPVALLLGAGLFSALLGRKEPIQRFLLLWFVAYYVFISADLGWDVRLTLPFYPPLLIWTADLISALRRAAPAAGCILLAYLLWIGLWRPVWPLKPEYTLSKSLRTEYMPLKDAADVLSQLPAGTRLLAIDCSRGCFSFYLLRPERLQWTVADSTALRSLDDLTGLCRRDRIDTVLYAAGAIEAFGLRKNPELFTAFTADNQRFNWRADLRLGDDRIAVKDFRPER